MTEGDIYTIAGAGVGGDGRPAGQASVDAIGVTVDDAGNVIVAEPLDVRVIAARAGRGYGQFFRAGDIYRIAGTSQFGITGDGGPALKAEFVPRDIAADAAGDLAIADPNAAVVRFVPAASGTFFGQRMRKGDIYSVARNVYTPNFGFPQSGIAFDAAGNVLAAQSGLPGVQVAAVRDGVFYGLAMTAGHVYRIPSNDDVGAVAVDSSGNVLMADTSDNTVSVLAVTSGTFYDRQMTAGNLYTIAGNGQQADTGDGGPATAAALAQPAAIAADHHGNMLIADLSGVRVVAATTGVFFGKHMTAGDIYTLTTGSSIDGLAVDKSGNVLAATFSRVKLIAARTGTFYGIRAVTGRVYAVAGNGQTGFSGDGGPAVRASLDETLSVAVGPAGNLLIADWLNMRIRSVTP
jgi:sugar lactone lactonase YvrE